MKSDQEFERMFRQEFKSIAPNLIWQSEDGYEVFEHYKIQPKSRGYQVFCGITDVGVFSSTRTALSW